VIEHVRADRPLPGGVARREPNVQLRQPGQGAVVGLTRQHDLARSASNGISELGLRGPAPSARELQDFDRLWGAGFRFAMVDDAQNPD
jgi:hypothetical protein